MGSKRYYQISFIDELHSGLLHTISPTVSLFRLLAIFPVSTTLHFQKSSPLFPAGGFHESMRTAKLMPLKLIAHKIVQFFDISKLSGAK